MASARCDRLITAETSRQYLAGELSAAEMYRIEYLMLENDFCFEAMEGLERVPWEHCQKAMESTSTRIRNQYNISSNERRRNTRLMAMALALAIGGLGLFWMYNSSNGTSMDLSTNGETLPPTQTEVNNPVTEEHQEEPFEEPQEVELLDVDPQDQQLDSESTETPKKAEVIDPPATATIKKPTVDFSGPKHIAVGRIIDPKGLALNGVSVRVGEEQSQTDQGGYYTLNLPSGKMMLTLDYMGLSFETEIDSDQNWQIVLDVNEGKLIDSQALNSANRFK